MAVALCVLFYLHRRTIKRQRIEDAKDPHRDLDFGLDDGPMPGRKKKGRMSTLMGGEKSSHKTNQLSMDMNLESPYLLPPKVQGSQDSVHTLTRGYPTEYDRYRMVPSECGSIRSFNKEPSVFGGSNKRASVITGRSLKMGSRQGSFPKSPLDHTTSSIEKDPFGTPPAAPEPTHRGPTTAEFQEPIIPIKPVVPEISTVPYPDDDKDLPTVPGIQEPAPVVARNPEDRIASPPRESHQFDFGVTQSDNMGNVGVARAGDDSLRKHQEPAGLGLNLDLPQPISPLNDGMFSEGHGGHGQPLAGQAATTPDNRQSKESDYGYQAYNPQIQTTEYYDDYEDYGRGRSEARDPPVEPGEQSPAPQGLGVPQQDNKRLSVGFRPLPPDDVTESEDPEYRANRIRSFYKEYFDDSKEAAPPMPAVPADYYGGGEYYEDYDERYLGEATYFDPDTNAFVMPGAQPVHRRAMTPPPAGRRPMGPGPRGPPGGRHGPRPPHAPHGSLGGMSLPGGPRSRSRANSAWGSRAPSSLGPRPDSSASARAGRQTPRRNLPPPAALNTLPTPSKLRDDSFAIFNAADFAPPESFGSRARGRSQSPLGERRPYSPQVPSASPLVTSYEELPALPSP